MNKLTSIIFLIFITCIAFIFRIYKSEINLTVIVSILTIPLTYLLASKIFLKEKKQDLISILSSFLVAISPWHIYSTQVFSQAIIVIFLVMLGVYFLLKANRKIKVGQKWFYLGLLFGLILTLPIFFRLIKLPYTSKTDLIFNNVNVLNDYKIERSQGSENRLINTLFHNQFIFYGRKIVNNYFYHFTPEFLFINAGLSPDKESAQLGLMYIWESIFLISGLYFVFKRKIKRELVLLLWLFLAPLSAVFLTNAPSVFQSAMMMPAIQILTAFGVIKVFENKDKKIQIFGLAMLFMAVILGLLKFINSYYFHL